MIELIAAITVLCGIYVICYQLNDLAELIEYRAEKKSQQRRAAARHRYYSAMNARWAVHVNREALWKEMQK